jgi:hypothetical protein
MSTRRLISEAELETLQRETFDFFVHEANPANGLIIDKTKANWPASIATTGLALAAYPVGVERGFWVRSVAAKHSDHPALLLEQPAGARAGRHQPSRVLLSFSRNADRLPRLTLRSVDHR